MRRALAGILGVAVAATVAVVVPPPSAAVTRSGEVLRALEEAKRSLDTPVAAARKRAPARPRRAAPAPSSASSSTAPAPPAADPARQDWEQARALALDGKHDESLALIREALGRHPDDTDLLWLQGNVTGWAGKHREAVALFEDLMTKHPELARGLRSDLAAERLWAGDAAGAVRDLDLRLQEEPNDHDAMRTRALALSHADRLTESLAAYDALLRETPGDVDLQLERARVLAWMGRHPQASAAYQAVLDAHPDNVAAREGLAQNENWGGHHRQAAALYEQLIASGDADPDVLKGAAYAYYWSGQPDLSRDKLDAFLTRAPSDHEGRELASLLARENGRSLTGGFERSDDTDALRVRSTTFDYRQPFARRNAFLVSWRRDDVQDADGDRTPWRLGAGIDKRWSARWSGRLMGYFFKPSDDEDGIGLGTGALTFRPVDRVRADFELSRDVILTRLSLAENIRMNGAGLGVDWQARERLTLTAAGHLAHTSDDNRLIRLSARARAVLLARRHGEIGARLGIEHLQSREDLDHGYYDPERYLEWGPGLDLEWHPIERWTLGFEGKVGYQHEKGSEQEPMNAFTATTDLPLGSVLLLHVEGGQSDSNLSSASGFRQKRWAAYLTTGF